MHRDVFKVKLVAAVLSWLLQPALVAQKDTGGEERIDDGDVAESDVLDGDLEGSRGKAVEHGEKKKKKKK